MNLATGMDACVFHPSKDTVYMHVAKEAVKNLQLKFYSILMFFSSSLTQLFNGILNPHQDSLLLPLWPMAACNEAISGLGVTMTL